ncbi:MULTISPECIES: NUDIX hydrolase [Eubacterium]|uniref:ADP-ribose pyrophosphatase YjhB, NUDIX family n=1 Tax=Eubacterium barkeri TaxID=1528 RepID=A0A1H3CF47_EUBBA|nr:NUDIX hydrolase [Eubacterium barkeri]SDX52119.1 ADP-ribose pyrophosphatase YjhB, NUDIX family [Eubacterium barkeri]
MEEKWLTWAKKIQSLSQCGLAYCDNQFDIERYEAFRALSIEILETYTEVDTHQIKDLFCNETGYQTPKVDVRGAIFKNDQILLVKETQDGKWSMPGGWADIGLSVKENVEKEVREEAGMVVHATRLVAMMDWLRSQKNCPFSIYKVFMLCDIEGGHFMENIETEAADFFSLETLPPLSHRITKDTVEMCYAAYRDETWISKID